MTDQLRDLLQRAVPEDAPALDPHRVAGAARRRARRRSAAVLAGVAASIVAGVGVVAVATSGDEGGQVAREPKPAPAPFDVPQCPAQLPELAAADHVVESLDGLVAVRLCPDLGAIPGWEPTSTDRAVLEGMDALVHDIGSFADTLANVRAFDPGRCAAVDVFPSRQSLLFVYDDGRTGLTPTLMCSRIQVAGREIDGQDLAGVHLAALDRQRDELSYGRPFESTLTCGPPFLTTPAQPGREEITTAVSCQRGGSTGIPLDEDQLAALNAAWDDPGDVAAEPLEGDRGSCTEVAADGATLVAGTDHGDVVHLYESPCGFFVWTSWAVGEDKALPITPADVGLR